MSFLRSLFKVATSDAEVEQIENILIDLRCRSLEKSHPSSRKKAIRMGIPFHWFLTVLMLPLLTVSHFKTLLLGSALSVIPFLILGGFSGKNFTLTALAAWVALNYSSAYRAAVHLFFDLADLVSGGQLTEMVIARWRELPISRKRKFLQKGKRYHLVSHLYSTRHCLEPKLETRWESYFAEIAPIICDEPELVGLEADNYWRKINEETSVFNTRTPVEIGSAGCWLNLSWTSLTPAFLWIVLSRIGDVNETDVQTKRTILGSAVTGGASVEQVKALLNAGADVNAPQGSLWSESKVSILELAISNGGEHLLPTLLENGASVSATEDLSVTGIVPSGWKGGHNFLEGALLTIQDGEIFRSLLEKGNPMIIDPRGNTLLHYAVISPKSKAKHIRALVGAGLDIDSKNNEGLTPLLHGIVAIVFGPSVLYGKGAAHLDNMETLLKLGANAKVTNEWGEGPLHLLSTSPFSIELYEARTKLLVDYGADIEGRDQFEKTPLMSAAANGTPELVGALLELGADVGAKTLAGKTALAFACGRKIDRETLHYNLSAYHRIIDIFAHWGANLASASSEGSESWISIIANRIPDHELDLVAKVDGSPLADALRIWRAERDDGSR
jgi:ankyrin repeat protein